MNVHTNVDSVPRRSDRKLVVLNMKGFTLEKSLTNVPIVVGPLLRNVTLKTMKGVANRKQIPKMMVFQLTVLYKQSLLVAFSVENLSRSRII